MALGFFEGDNAPDTYESRERRRRLAEAMMAQGMETTPIQSWTQGAARLAQALSGNIQQRRIDSAQREADRPLQEAIAAHLRSQGMPPSASPYTAGPQADAGGAPKPNLPTMASGGNIPRMVMPDPVSADLTPQQRGLLNAIAAPESAGAYNIRYTPRGGATFAGFDAHPGVYEPGPAGPSSAAGRYQFTKTTWDRMGGGAFTPENQDRRALALASEDYKARTGRDLMGDLSANGFTPEIAQALGPTWRGLIDNPQKAIAAYRAAVGQGQPAQVAQAGGGAPAPLAGGSDFTGATPQRVASLDGLPPGPVPSNAPPMAYAASPAGAALTGALQRPTSPPIPSPQPTGNPGAALLAAAMSPGVSPQLQRQAMALYEMGQRDEGVTYVDAGDKLVPVNKRGQVVGQPIAKSRDSADWEPIKDSDGNVIGSFNKRTSETKPLSGQGGLPQPSNEVELADGTKIPIPQGDKGVFRKKIQEENANVIASAPKSFSNLERAYKNASELENHPGLKSGPFNLLGATGPLGGITTQVRGTDAYKVQARIDELLGGTFLQAYDALRGGGQITQIEGDKAQAAMSRLGKPGVGPEEYAAAIKEFKDAVRSGMEKLKRVKGMDDPRYKLPEDKPATPAKPSAPAAPMQGWSVEVIP